MKILIIEDEKYFRNYLSNELSQYGEVLTACNLKEAQKALKEEIDVAFIDLDLSESSKLEGLEVVKKCQKYKTIPIVLTGHDSKKVIEIAYKNGCHHYFAKKDFYENIHNLVGGILKSVEQNDLDNFFSKEYITKEVSLRNSIGYLLDEFKNSDRPVLITGPTGVGKTKIAKFLQKKVMKNSPFVHINLSEISENLLESELFGHKKGAFTGANSDKIGLLESANGGVLFIDEIGTISLFMQRKLLRAIEEKKFFPVGSTREVSSNFRLITATCDDIQSLLGKGEFRLDFYFRIRGLELKVPPLKERRGDIIPLLDYFISKSSKKIALSEDAESALKNYSWYGNIRELENLFKELIGKSKGIVKRDDLPYYVLENKNPIDQDEEKKGWLNHDMRNFVFENGLSSLVERIEMEILKEAQKKFNGRTNEIVRQLKISKSLYYRIFNNLVKECRF